MEKEEITESLQTLLDLLSNKEEIPEDYHYMIFKQQWDSVK